MKFLRNKTHINVGTIGHVDHGKSTLTAAITKTLNEKLQNSKFYDLAEIDKSPEEKQRGITINSTTVEYETDNFHFAHVDCPGHEDYIKNMITGASQMDGAILVVALDDGTMAQTKEHIRLAKQIGIRNLVVFLNKEDIEHEDFAIEAIQEEVTELLEECGYDQDFISSVKFVSGSALKALEGEEKYKEKIIELVSNMEKFTLPTKDLDKPFLLSVDSVNSIKGKGTVVTGRIETGKILPDTEVQILGGKQSFNTTVKEVETFKKSLDYGEAGDNVGILLRKLERSDIKRGNVVCKPGSVTMNKLFEVEMYALKTEEGGRRKPFGKDNKYTPQIFCRTANITGRIILPEGVEYINPGDNLSVKIELIQKHPITTGLNVIIRESDTTVALAKVTKIIE